MLNKYTHLEASLPYGCCWMQPGLPSTAMQSWLQFYVGAEHGKMRVLASTLHGCPGLMAQSGKGKGRSIALL